MKLRAGKEYNYENNSKIFIARDNDYNNTYTICIYNQIGNCLLENKDFEKEEVEEMVEEYEL